MTAFAFASQTIDEKRLYGSQLMHITMLLALSLAFSSSALAAEHRLQPASQWQLDHVKPNGIHQICRLSRDFGEGKQRVSIRMEQFGPGAHAHVILTGKLFLRAESGRSFIVRFGSGGDSTEALTLRVTLPNNQTAILLPNIRLQERPDRAERIVLQEAELKRIDEISFSAAPMGTVKLQTNSFASAMIEMQKCTDRMVEEWGFEPRQQASLIRLPTPIGAPFDWIKSKDFPLQSAMRGQSSVIAFRLRIEPDGAVSTCDVSRAYTIETFAQLSCDLIKARAKFRPAIDSNGQALASSSKLLDLASGVARCRVHT